MSSHITDLVSMRNLLLSLTFVRIEWGGEVLVREWMGMNIIGETHAKV